MPSTEFTDIIFEFNGFTEKCAQITATPKRQLQDDITDYCPCNVRELTERIMGPTHYIDHSKLKFMHLHGEFLNIVSINCHNCLKIFIL